MTNFFNALKEMQKLQEQVAEAKHSFSNIHEEGASGGGLVKVVLNGNMTLLSIKIDPILLEGKDVEMLQDLIIAAHNNATEKLEEKIKERLASIATQT